MRPPALCLDTLRLRCRPFHRPPQTVKCQPGSIVPTRALRARAGGLAKAGKPTRVAANHFRMKLSATQAFHYDVAIDRLLSEEETAKAAARKAKGERWLGWWSGEGGGRGAGGVHPSCRGPAALHSSAAIRVFATDRSVRLI